jgi:biotin-(acetyl-CoA carboxylase) ligase
LAGRIGEWLDRYDSGEHEYIIDAWIGYAIWLGAEVEVVTDTVLRGTFTGIDRDGALRLETPTGEMTLASGDVSRGPRQSASSYT